MSGKSVTVAGARRGYQLTDEAATRVVAALLDASPPHSGRAFDLRSANRFPHTLRANAAGAPVALVLTTLNGVPQTVLVERLRGPDARRMTCVPVRFDRQLFECGVVMAGVLLRQPEPLLVVEDVLSVGGGCVEAADALERATMLYNVVHEHHRADAVLQPFKLQCARHLPADGCEARSVFQTYGYPIGSLTLCPMHAGQKDMWVRTAPGKRANAGPAARSPAGAARRSGGVEHVSVRAADMPDVYMVADGSGPVVIRTLEDSRAVRALAAAGGDFLLPARWDGNARRWVYVPADTA